MKTFLFALPLLMSVCFLMLSALNAIRLVVKARRDGESDRSFEIKQSWRLASISGIYMALAIASLALLGLIPDTGADSLTVIGCFGLSSLPFGITVTIGNYLRAKKAFQLSQKLSQNS